MIAVLKNYPGLGPVRQIHELGNAGGFSGCLLWRIEREAGDLCLRRWSQEHPSQERLTMIHGVLAALVKSGLTFIPVPLLTRGGLTFLSHSSHFWELVPWMPGKADFHENPSRTRLANVIEATARIHQQAQSFSPPLQQTSPTLLSRREQLQRLLHGGADQLAAAVERHQDCELQSRGRQLLAHFRQRASTAMALLDALHSTPVPLFPVIRDLWHDHIFFTGDEVTGIVDFGAVRVDSVACDLSRLLGSLVRNDRAAWEFARQSYGSIRPLSADEWKLTQALDAANVLLAGLNWLDWICIQGRKFENLAVIHARLDEILSQLAGA